MFEFKGSAAEFLQLNCPLFFTEQLHVYTPTPVPVALHFTKWLSNPPGAVQKSAPPALHASPLLSCAVAFYLGDWLLQTTKILSRRRQWHPTPVLLPGKSHGWRSLEGCSPWGRWGSDTTSLSLFTFMHWRRKWQPTPVFLPGEFPGQWAAVYGVAQSRTRLKRLSSSSRKKSRLYIVTLFI